MCKCKRRERRRLNRLKVVLAGKDMTNKRLADVDDLLWTE